MSTLFDACLTGKFPDLNTLVDYGLDGRDGVNPVYLFEKYIALVKGGFVDAKKLHNAMMSDTLSDLVGIKVKSGYNSKNEMASCNVHVW